MEFPEINMISDFEAGVKCLQKVPQVYSFWKWGALVFAILATFSSLIRKIKILFIYISTLKPSTEPLLQYIGEDFDISSSSDDEDEDNRCSSSSSICSDDEEDNMNPQIIQDFNVAGSSFYFREKGQNRNLRQRRRLSCSFERLTWTDFSAKESVVKLWDSLGLSLDLDINYECDDLCKSVVSIWDFNKEQKVTDLFNGTTKVPSVGITSKNMVISSEVKEKDRNNDVLAVFDTRMKSQTPVICVDWDMRAGKVVGVNGDGNGKVFVRNEATGTLTVGDMRNVKTPLEKLTESENDDTWWDADAVIVEEEKC